MNRSSYLVWKVSLAAFFSFCCSDGGSGPVVAASITAPGGTLLAGIVAQSLAVQVQVTGSDGKPYAGGIVSFSVTSGGGSASPAQASLDQSGRASTSWTLGPTAGTQSLTASVGGLSLQIDAQAQAGPATSIEAVTSFVGQFDPGQTLDQDAEFVVRDQFNNPVRGETVNFEASSGGTAAPAQATTNDGGQVFTTWTLGPDNGIQTLTATVVAVPSAVMSAEAYDPCLEYEAYTLGQTVEAAITPESCSFDVGVYSGLRNQYAFQLTNSGSFQFTVTADFSEPVLSIGGYGIGSGQVGVGTNTVSIKAFLDAEAAGKDYMLFVQTNSTISGSYVLSSGPTSGQMEGCEAWASTWFSGSPQTLAATDCNQTDELGTILRYYDELRLNIPEGQSIRITMSSSAFAPQIKVYRQMEFDGVPLGVAGDGTQSDVSLDFVAPGAILDLYLLRLSSNGLQDEGAYMFSITPIIGD